MSINHDDFTARAGSSSSRDPHGQAALLLVESLIHGLCEKAHLTVDDAIEITQRAIDVQLDHIDATDGATEPMWQVHALLSSVAASLKTDGVQTPKSPRAAT